MKLIICEHSFRYETENLCRVFFPHEPIEVVGENDGQGEYVFTKRIRGEQADVLYACACVCGEKREAQRIAEHTQDKLEDYCELQLSLALFEVLTALTGYTPPWGLLTGVRPAKLMSKCSEETGSEKARDYFLNTLLVSREKTELAQRVAEKESGIVALSQPMSYSLYVSIPFCPTRCSYCSFVSHSNLSAKKLIPQYIKLLCREISETAQYAHTLGLKLESIYYGGGTPTVLDASQLDEVMDSVSESFDTADIREYTVEAGRPDSITNDKLDVIKKHGAGRISINPQTFDDEILKLIGRQHTAQQTLLAFEAARDAGFTNINMDLIAGLPGDTAEGFHATLEKTLELQPESITVHTLALKRSSEMVTQHRDRSDALAVQEMLKDVPEMLYPLGYKPYYMYRQSKMVGNMENVGWSKDGFESLYNVFMMEECHTILGVGAAAVTKLKAPNSSEIERIFNFKYPYEYINRFDELLQRKRYIQQFYDKYC